MSHIVSRLTTILLSLLALLLSQHVRAQLPQQVFFPSAVPLAVRSPYLHCWHQSGGAPEHVFGSIWPTFLNISQKLSWSALVRVDGLTYSLLGDIPSNGTANTTNLVITPTQTVITAQAGPMQVNLTFLNPIELQDWVKQSIPFSYLSLTAASTDGASHDVQVYSDVSGEWNSGDRTQTILWSTSNADVIFHSVTLQKQVKFTEVIDQAEWGTLYYAMIAGNNVTQQIARATDSRSNFTRNGVLNGQLDPRIRSISDHWPVFAISRDLGTIEAMQTPVVWAIGYTTDPAIGYSDRSGAPPTFRSPYYKTRYPNDKDLIVDFLKDYGNALTRAQNLDEKILQLANAISTNLGNLISVSIRHVFGSMQLTIGTDAHGNFNNSDVMMFMKNIGGARKNRVNAVETLYAAFPTLMSINASFGAPLLEPLFRLQASSKYTIPYAAADLGSNYPNVSGSNSRHNQGIEQTANMLIMTYAYARASGDGSFISKYYDLLAKWATYLNAHTLFTNKQTSADNLSVNNQTNLAIKGIIAIQAMSKMSAVIAGKSDDVNKYSSAAARLYAQWKSYALGSGQHILAVYGQNNSWTLGYNLFADVWLGTTLVESSIYDGHSQFLHNLVLTSDFCKFGMPVDSLNRNIAVSSWSLFAAAMTSNQGLRSDLITRVFNRVNNRTILGAFPVYYDSSLGSAVQGVASPAQGTVLAPIAGQFVQQINAIDATTKKSSPRKKLPTGVIVGIVVGGLSGVIGLLVMIGVGLRRRRRQRQERPTSHLPFPTDNRNPMDTGPEATPSGLNSYVFEEILTPEWRDSGTEQRQPLMSTDDQEGDSEVDAPHRPSSGSSPPAAVPPSRPAAPVPGMSGKELRRSRVEALVSGSQQQFRSLSTPNASQPTSSTAYPVTESSEANPSSYSESREYSWRWRGSDNGGATELYYGRG